MDLSGRLHFLLILVIVMIVSSCLAITVIGNKLLYITPSQSVTCPGKPCLTLYQFAASDSWINSSSTLVFLPGIHRLSLEVSVSGISNFSMLSNSTLEGFQVDIICYQSASFKFDNMDNLLIRGLKFIGCGDNRALSVELFIIENSIFQGQNYSGTALEVNETYVEIRNSLFNSNTVGRCIIVIAMTVEKYVRVGGAIYATQSNVTITDSTFVGNSAEIGGAICIDDFSYAKIVDSTFVENQAANHAADFNTQCSDNVLYRNAWTENKTTEFVVCGGGAIVVFQSKLIINNSTFSSSINECESGGAGALSIQHNSVATIYVSEFWNNTVIKGFGGALSVSKSNATIDNSSFYNNSAKQGGVMDVIQSSVVVLSSCEYYNNSANVSGGVIVTDETSQLTDSGGQFINNRAATGGALSAARSTVVFRDSIFSNNQATESGGAIYTIQSDLFFHGFCNLTDNFASTGGAIYATESTLDVCTSGHFIVMLNMASDSGGGLYLYHSNLNSRYSSIAEISGNLANNSGGGIHAINSLITAYYNRRPNPESPDGYIHFTVNTAHKGGGICLESAAQLRVQKTGPGDYYTGKKGNVSIYFTSNTADYGDAIYVVDETYFDVCARESIAINSTTASTADCFIQVLSQTTTLNRDLHNISIEFDTSHSDNSSRSTIVGGLLDRCIPDPHAEIFTDENMPEIDGLTYLKLISNIKDTNSISSSPVKLCFCTPNDQPDCTYQPIIQVKKGELFNVSLVAVDQVKHTVGNVMIHISLNHTESGLGEGQMIQMTKNACTNLNFSVRSPHSSEQLNLYAEGPCRNSSMSQRRVNVTFCPCSCPIGFEQKNNSLNCECDCDSELKRYIADLICEYQSESLIRKGDFWITFMNDSNSSGYLIYPHCPFDYCLLSHSNVQINLNVDNGADAQCANNRSGTLCGVCQPGLSLSLGSSHCIHCPKDWYINFIVIVIVALVAGIVLVALLMVLNLTVAVGTLNGLIFYANIIGANSSTFFTGSSSSTRFLSIIISLINLNLEVGFDICFFEGMDTYWKTWLHLFFPTYVILLVVLIILISKHSMRFSRLIARKNPVATLATLILLSYTMFLRNTIAILSFADLHYPNGSHEWVWLPDASVEYLSGKHIALFIAAILILIVGIAYTILIFFWQWLLYHQNKAAFKWVRYQRLCHFIEPYHAPYVFKHRYWTGLLLFARVGLHLVFALNVSGDPGVNLLTVIVLIVGIFSLKGHYGKIYKKNVIDMIEMACYVNVGIFSATQLLLLEGGIEQTVNIDAPAYISGIITLILLLAVLTYHGFTVFLSNSLKKCKQRENRYDENERDNDDHIGHPISKPTSTVVEGPQHLDISRFEWGQRSCSIGEQSNLLHSPNYDTAFNRRYGSTLL